MTVSGDPDSISRLIQAIHRLPPDKPVEGRQPWIQQIHRQKNHKGSNEISSVVWPQRDLGSREFTDLSDKLLFMLCLSGEPGGNRTHNPQIKSLLLCQLSYRPQSTRIDSCDHLVIGSSAVTITSRSMIR